MSGKAWTTCEEGYVKRHYRRMLTAEIAERLGRSRQQVYRKADHLGLMRPRPKLTPARERTIRKMNAAGHPDSDIARRLKSKRETVGVWRRRLGLPSQALSERRRRRIAKKTREQLRKAGCRSLAELEKRVITGRIRRLGWPEDLRWRAVQMLETLWLLGPRTRRQLADEIGMPWKGSRQSLHSNAPEGSHLAHLAARGLVVNLGRSIRNGGQGKNTCLYALPIDVVPDRRDLDRPVPKVFVPESAMSFEL